MALRLFASSVARRSVMFTRAAGLSTSRIVKQADNATIPTDLEQATGVERKELEAILAGNPDPFNLNVKKGVPGTLDAPTLVPSMYEERIIGCVCEEDSTTISWMWLKKGPAVRCKCGNFFQLVPGKSNALAD
ncbi:cytochrome c oxidase subunit 5B, mitochondrial-like [Hydractinia symbiolongicarpus]|uniref:cytochrome c oxidase subunit 5B, mitochondrial-like n=1 Tax=Hydractinia symbiolongicarpus TaxID=13093 RepID=UPI00254B63E4|nr:cytochrome c oxidase subunit 5B, mitochondrial-like [Hydractinia symbiolongicarpus]